MDLRDRFALACVATLARRVERVPVGLAGSAAADVEPEAAPSEIAARAYDLADAMLRERARRIDADERGAIAWESGASQLLDLPAELEEDDCADALDPQWLEPEIDPSWDREPRWSGALASAAPRPGLARTQPPDVDHTRKVRGG